MSREIFEALKKIKISNYIYAIFILVSLIGFYSNKEQKEYTLNININGKKHAHNARLVILVIALIIYIYYLETRIRSKDRTNDFFRHLDILSGILFLIGGIIMLYLEIKGDEEIIITE